MRTARLVWLLCCAGCFLFLAAGGASEGCVPVEGSRILGRHLAAAGLSFSSLRADADIAHAPSPGARRYFRAGELRRLAARYGSLTGEGGEVCFERAVVPLEADRLLGAMRAALPAEARIEIVDFSRYPTPTGEVVFPLSGILRSAELRPDAPMHWRGYVKYDVNHRFPIWAKVRMAATSRRVVAVERLAAGRTITAEQLRLETAEVFPSPSLATTLEQVIGCVPRHAIPAGAAISTSDVEAPREVAAGETVSVEARYGAAKIEILGRAESAGRRGELIWVKNTASGARFRACVDGKGHALATGVAMRAPGERRR